jgi:hypothetical protein
VDGIADPYSSQLEAYRTARRGIMNDTYEVAEASSERNLYSLFESVSPARAQSAEVLAR